jgi:GntR family transcriptional regulator
MFEKIDPRSPTPLYEQIASRIRVAVASGEVEPGDPLPSVRQLAARLRVNPATVVQAYRDLAGEGFVVMRHGAGTFVGEVAAERREEERREQARALVKELLERAARKGIGVEEVREAIREELGGDVAVPAVETLGTGEPE